MPFRQLKSFLKILIGVQYENSQRARCHVKEPTFFPCASIKLRIAAWSILVHFRRCGRRVLRGAAFRQRPFVTDDEIVCGSQRIFCPDCAVWKAWNTYSIPALFKLSFVTKSLAVSSCRFHHRLLKPAYFSMFLPGQEHCPQRNQHRNILWVLEQKDRLAIHGSM